MGSPHHFDLVKNARRRISILGPSAGGKGEFAAAFMRCCDKPYIHLESGNFFRAALGANPDLRRRVNSGEVIATLDPISDQVTDGYSQAIRVLSDGGYVLEDGLHRRPEQVSLETPFWFADAALTHGRRTPVYDSRTFYQQRFIDEANEATKHMRFVMMEADPNMCFQLMQVRFGKELEKAKRRFEGHSNAEVARLLSVLTNLHSHNLELANNRFQGGDLQHWTTNTIADYVKQAAQEAGLQDPDAWLDPSKLLNRLIPSQEEPIKMRMDDMIPASAIARTTNCKIPPSVEGGQWSLGPVGETAISIGYTFDKVSGTFGVPPELSHRLAIVHNPGLVEGGYAQLQENCRNQAMRWIEEDRREGIEGEMTRSAAMRR